MHGIIEIVKMNGNLGDEAIDDNAAPVIGSFGVAVFEPGTADNAAGNQNADAVVIGANNLAVNRANNVVNGADVIAANNPAVNVAANAVRNRAQPAARNPAARNALCNGGCNRHCPAGIRNLIYYINFLFLNN